ncbi:hypothetical protein [Pseudonocardia endophytica]|uniref:Excreted virulence factor EspC (Type VII ESX diderm) n=1 Tax=Pseudonocardia endophytica TaxID=401976 RepID=A0A4R1HJU6_PSEEN|nr:hypothetical protein [Pseudonocardia endophytica]TCK21271.1 hypothetical protein EV378_5252 [Pseudonocardia endophytica]
MVEPDVRVNPVDLDAAGSELVELGTALADAMRSPDALRTDPAFSAGFSSVGATARLAELWRSDIVRHADEVVGQGNAMRAAADAWRTADGAVADRLRAG